MCLTAAFSHIMIRKELILILFIYEIYISIKLSQCTSIFYSLILTSRENQEINKSNPI